MTPATATATSIDCPGCGAGISTGTRRCRRDCTRINDSPVPRPERGLHPDSGHGASFRAGWGRPSSRALRRATSPAEDGRDPLATHADASAGGGAPSRTPRTLFSGAPRPRSTSFPVEATIPQWEPTSDGTDDESVELATTIVVAAPLRNGATPPLLEFEHEHFDPDGLDWDGVRP